MHPAAATRFLVLGILFLTVCIFTLIALLRLLQRIRGRKLTTFDRAAFILGPGSLLIGALCFLWALYVEPDWISETHLEVRTHKLSPGKSLRIVQLSDLHVDKWRPVFRELPARVNALHPDLLIFTGDSISLPTGTQVLHELLSQITATHGRYAVRGNHDVWYFLKKDLFGSGVANELTGARTDIADTNISICGAPYGDTAALDSCLDATPSDRFRIVAFHTPDDVEHAAERNPDLYLAGHTHGGQVRIPFCGAVITESAFDKKYEMGEYRVNDTTLFVSRGVGVEPGMPRIRFDCRPEIAVIDLVGE